MRRSRQIIRYVPAIVIAGLALCPFTIGDAANQENAETYNQRGLALMSAENFDEAIKAFKEAVRLKPDFAEAFYHLGDSYMEMGDAKQAVDAYKESINQKPDFVEAYDHLGIAYEARRDNKRAVESFAEAIRLDPKAKTSYYNLGVFYAQHDKQKDALSQYKVLQSLDAALAQDLYNWIYQPTNPLVSDGVVRVHAIAIDGQGAPVSGLTADDFQVTEDGVRQSASISFTSDGPAFYGIAVDTSGSMRASFSFLIAATRKVVQKTSARDQTLLVRFISSDKIETVQEFTSSKRKLLSAIDQLFIEAGQSAVLDAVYVAAQRLASYKFPDKTIRRVMILLTDGDDRQSYYSAQQLVAFLRTIDVQIFVISFDTTGGKLNENQPKRAADRLRALASETGGAALFPTSPAGLNAAIDRVFDLVHAEYSIEYKPSKPVEKNIYRPISISLSPKPQRQSVSVIARPGYVVKGK
jgi:Ca-activated chloride channel family protein